MKYRVTIPAPSAKRMAGKKILKVEAHDGWGQGWQKSYDLTNEVEFDFEVSDDVDWAGNTSVTDGMTFSVCIEYSNSTGSRKQTVRLVPQKL